MNFIRIILRKIKADARRAALSTMEMMILIVVVAAVVGVAAGILSNKMNNMSQHVDDTLTQVTQDIISHSSGS